MRRLVMTTAASALLAAGLFAAEGATAAPLGAGPAGPNGTTSLAEPVDYLYRGRNYCWYYDGWQGPGWYWCGYEWRRGYGWGSPVWGWNNWAWSGPRFRDGRGDRFRGGDRGRGPVQRLERRGDRGEHRGDRR